MASPTQPGDGRTSPFGDGAGGSKEQAMASGNNFLENPRGTGGGKPPRDFLRPTVAQKPAGQRTNPADAAPGANTAAEGANRPGAGVGSIGNAARPYKLGG